MSETLLFIRVASISAWSKGVNFIAAAGTWTLTPSMLSTSLSSLGVNAACKSAMVSQQSMDETGEPDWLWSQVQLTKPALAFQYC